MDEAMARAMDVGVRPVLPTSRPGSGIYKKGRKRLRAILESAERMIARDGYSSFSMRRVAAECDISLAALQHYFPSLQLMVGALLSFLVARYRAQIRSLPALTSDDPMKRLDALVNYFLVDLKSEHNRRLFAELWALALRDREVAAEMDKLTLQYRNGFEQALAGVNPDLTPAQRRRRAALIIALIDGLGQYVQPGAVRRALIDGLERDARKQIVALAMMP